jgi:hypothetical protein
MTANYSADITFLQLQNLVLRELKEPENLGSEAVPLDLVKDTINTLYAESFNDRRIKQSARENDISFGVASSDATTADANIGDVTIYIGDTTTYLSAGKLLLNSDIITYTGKTATSFTGVTSLTTFIPVGTMVRQMYPLATLASDLDDEQIQYVHINGLPQQYMPYENLITAVNFYPNTYTIYKGNLIFSRQSYVATGNAQPTCLLVYTQKVTLLSGDSDKPALIPNSYRVPLLVYGSCWRIAAADAFKTSFDYWKKSYDTALSQFIAQKNNRVLDRNTTRRPCLYTTYSPYSLR